MVIGSTFRSSASRPPSQAFLAEPRVRSLAVLAESAANPQSFDSAEDICWKRYPNDSTALALTRGAVVPSSTAIAALAGPIAAWAATRIALAAPSAGAAFARGMRLDMAGRSQATIPSVVCSAADTLFVAEAAPTRLEISPAQPAAGCVPDTQPKSRNPTMRQKGRPPASSLSVVTLPVEPAKRPEPPAHLSEAEKGHWRQIVGALPAPYFRADYLPMLEALVCTIEGTRGVEAILRAEPVMSGKWRIAAARHDLQSRTIASLSTKLRLTPQRRAYSARELEEMETAGMRKPWER